MVRYVPIQSWYVPIHCADTDAMRERYEALLGRLDVGVKRLDAALKTYHDALVDVELLPDSDTTMDTAFRKHQDRVQDGIDTMLKHWDTVGIGDDSLRSAIAAMTKHGEQLTGLFEAVQVALDDIEKSDGEDLDTKTLSRALHALQAVLRESAEEFYLSLSDLANRDEE